MVHSDETERAARLLEAYWRANPLAADTAEGIRQWWIGEAVVTQRGLEEALQALAAQGRVRAVRAADGRVRYHWTG